jgi:hypothetical protein
VVDEALPRQAQHRAHRAVSDARQQGDGIFVGHLRQQGHDHAGHAGHRVRRAGPTQLLDHADEVDLGEAHAALVLGHEQGDDAHLDQAVPKAGHASVAGPGLAQPLGRALLGQQLGHGFAEGDLVVGEGEVHRSYFRGSPSTRSATTLRWISFVPA